MLAGPPQALTATRCLMDLGLLSFAVLYSGFRVDVTDLKMFFTSGVI